MNRATPTPLIPEEELRIAEARLATFDQNQLGHTLEALRQWSEQRASDPTTPCPPPTRLR